jgi:DNA polymerase-3 subunit epsilon
MPTPPAVQLTIDELGQPLATSTFVVVDLETTGGAPDVCDITEVGAVKVCGGEVLGEFNTLVRPTAPITPFISVLTGITDAMVASAPPISAVVSSFLEFARGSVLVAHNAPFDVGFLRKACDDASLAWPSFPVVDTARLARRIVTRDEARDCRLSTLARVFGATTTPNHRALADARATVDVLHGLIERVGNVGVYTVEELALWQSKVTPAQRSKRHLAEPLPNAPGVYIFKDANDQALYVGKSNNIRTRVRNYFTASETRNRMTEMVAIAESVTGITCETTLEAEVRELRLIAERKPRYNKRSKFPEKGVWVKLTVEAFPRLSVVRKVYDDGAAYLGPFGSRRIAEAAIAAVHEAVPIRQCTQRLSVKKPTSSACVLAEMGRCGAPCIGAETVDDYSEHVAHVRQAITADPGFLIDRLLARIDALAADERFEDAGVRRDRLTSFLRAAIRGQRIASLARVPQLIAARRHEEGGWELHVVRHGRLAAAGRSPSGADPRPYVSALTATAETVTPRTPPLAAATTEEVECILRWLDIPGTRIVDVDGTWTLPAPGAAAYQDLRSA